MKKKQMIKNSGIFLCLLAFCLTPVFAGETFQYQNGNRKQTLYTQSNLIVEFGAQGKSLRLLDTGAVLMHNTKRARLYRISMRSLQSLLSKGILPDQLKNTYSPVFSDYADGSGQIRAFAGGVVVSLNRNWSRTQVNAWMSSNGLRYEKKLPLKGNVYLVHSPRNLETLDLANRLHKLAGVLYASPNWWVQRALK